jgi:sugar phosphate isomerase/epimerase
MRKEDGAETIYSRRDFGKLALVGLPLSVMLGQTNSKIDSKVDGVRIGVQSYSFRTMSLDDAIKAMVQIGIGECELFAGHVEPARPAMPRPQGTASGPPPSASQFAQAQRGSAPSPEMQAAMKKNQEDLHKWRLTVPLDHFKGIRKKFDDAGVKLQAYNYSFNDTYSDEEIDRGFEMAKALGVGFITASSTLSAAKRVAPYADKHKMIVAMHGHSNITDSNEFAKPESFAQAMAMSKYFYVNLDIGHFFAAAYDPIAYINEHHDRITNLHLKDRKKDNGPNELWGEGDTPIKPVLQLLKQKKWNIPANIEYEYRGADTVAEVRKCFQYIKDALG